MIALKRVLVATDFSKPLTLPGGRALARTFGATLHVLHVADDMYVRLGGDAYWAVLPDRNSGGRAASERQTRQLRGRRFDAAADGTDQSSRRSATAPAIVNYAAQADIDLIVVGMHGRGRRLLLMGSVAERGSSGRPDAPC
jgi:nucleotide-binding universal stress UspA family protein